MQVLRVPHSRFHPELPAGEGADRGADPAKADVGMNDTAIASAMIHANILFLISKFLLD